MKSYFLITLFASVLFFGCSSTKENEHPTIVGEWKAMWSTDPAAYPAELSKTKKFNMEGFLSFTDKGELTINAFGYKDCIFSSDTMKHSLNWKMVGDTAISFYSGEDVHGIHYQLEDLKKDKAKLVLMGDINISLTRID